MIEPKKYYENYITKICLGQALFLLKPRTFTCDIMKQSLEDTRQLLHHLCLNRGSLRDQHRFCKGNKRTFRKAHTRWSHSHVEYKVYLIEVVSKIDTASSNFKICI